MLWLERGSRMIDASFPLLLLPLAARDALNMTMGLGAGLHNPPLLLRGCFLF